MKEKTRTITVYSKDMKKIAVFSNASGTGEAAQLNNMVSPTVHLVSNGESTLSFQMYAGSEKWNQIKDPENIYECDDRFYTAATDHSIIYSGEIVEVVLVETWYLLKHKFVQAYNVDTKVEALDEHTVKILPKADAQFKLTVNGVEYSDAEVTDARGVVMPRGSAGYALWALLKGTDWRLGVCDVLPDGFNAKEDYGTFNVESDMKSVLENIQNVQAMYGGILDWDSKNKVLGLRDEKAKTEFNEWKGYELRKGKNLRGEPRITIDSNLVTRLYPLGNGNLNIKKVNDGKSYIENLSYTNQVYEGYIQNPNIYDTGDESGQKTLKAWAEKELEKLCKPRKSIEYDIVDLRSTKGFEHEVFKVNDVVKAYYKDPLTGVEAHEFVRVQEVSYNYFHSASDSTVVVGDKVINETQLFHNVLKKADSDAPTDNNGHISGDDIYIEIPEIYWGELGFDPVFGFGTGYGTGYGSLTELTALHAYHEDKNKDYITQTEAAVQVVANDLEAQVQSFTAFQKETENGFAGSSTRIDQVSNELQAQITLEALHYKETTDSIAASNARIDMVSNDLKAQITLEAAHHKKTTDGLSQSNARIDVVSDELKAQITLEAAHHSEAMDKAQRAIDSVASFKAEANNKYATTQMLSSYSTTDYVNGKVGEVSNSLAEFKTYASKNYAAASITATVNNLSSHITVSPSSIYLTGPLGPGRTFIKIDDGNMQIFSAGQITIRGSGGVLINGKRH